MARDFANQFIRHAQRKRIRKHRHQGNRHRMPLKGKRVPQPTPRY